MASTPFKKFFNHQSSSCYDNEKLLFGHFVGEAISQQGVRSEFFIVDYNTNYDKLNGEDNDRTIQRKFSVMLYYTLPPEDMLISMYGIENTDKFKMWASKDQFRIASTTNPDDFATATKNSNPAYIPKEGDIVRSIPTDTLYEIMNVKDAVEEQQFLQSKNVWEFSVRVYRDLHYNVSTDVASVSGISAFTDQQDYLEINDVIDTLTPSILITSADDIANGDSVPNDPFGVW